MTRTLPDLALLPYPRRILPGTGYFMWRRQSQARLYCAPRDAMAVVAGLAHDHIAMTVAESFGSRPALVIGGDRAAFRIRLVPPGVKDPEAYRLVISPSAIVITAHTPRGLQHAWMTLAQVRAECGDRLPCGTIDDAPAVAWRLQHLDLKGVRPTPNYLMRLLDRFAAIKINGILLEVEDHFRYDAFPAIAHPRALTKEFWRRFAARAAELHIEVTPLLQTWGHLQYILRVPRYRHLAEGGAGMIGEICPEHPETWPMLSSMIDELCEVFSASRYFHVGMDEVFHSGECLRCQPLKKRLGAGRFYIRYINRACGHVAARGRIPITWGGEDLISSSTRAELRAVVNPVTIRHPAGDFRHPIAMVFWTGYGHGTERSASCGLSCRVKLPSSEGDWRNHLLAGKTPDKLDAAERQVIRRYMMTSDGRALRPFYGLDYLRDLGFEVWDVPAVQYSAGTMGLAPDFAQRKANVLANCQAIKRAGGAGIISSFWARGHSNVRNNAPFEASWHGISAFADFSWRPLTATDPEEFDRRWCRNFLGIDDPAPAHALYVFSQSDVRTWHVGRDYTVQARTMLAAALPQAKRNQSFLAYADLGMRAHQLNLRLQRAQLEAEYLFATLQWVPDAFIRKCLVTLRTLPRDYRALDREMRRVYRPDLIASDIDELVEAEVVMNLKRIDQIRDLFRLGLARRRGRRGWGNV